MRSADCLRPRALRQAQSLELVETAQGRVAEAGTPVAGSSVIALLPRNAGSVHARKIHPNRKADGGNPKVLARKVLGNLPVTMDNVGHEPVNETAARRAGSAKARRGRPRKSSAPENVVQEQNNTHENVVEEQNSARENVVQQTNSSREDVGQEPSAGETLTPARSLLLAALRVWELKQRIGE